MNGRILSSIPLLAILASGCSGGGGGGPSCKAGTGPTTHAASLNSSETWTAAESPHLLDADTIINASAVITLEPCAVLQIAPKKSLAITGALHADGTAKQPVTIESSAPATGNFAVIHVFNGGTMRLVHTTVQGGGDPLNTLPIYAAAIDLQGDQTQPVQSMLDAQFLTVRGSLSQGMLVRERAGFAATSTDLTITGSTGYPMHIWAEAVGTIPTGSYTGNTNDEIYLPGTSGNEAIVRNTTMHDRGVPYHVGNGVTGKTLRVGALAGNPVAVLTIEPGVTMRFTAGGIFQVEAASSTNPANGALIAVGTPSKPITFTSAAATPAAGDWESILFGSLPDPQDQMDYTKVDYAGGDTIGGDSSCNGMPYNAAIRLIGGAAPTSQFITHTTIDHSKGHGIDRGWRDDSQPDFLATNTFNNVAGCRETQPAASSGACPMPVPCP